MKTYSNGLFLTHLIGNVGLGLLLEEFQLYLVHRPMRCLSHKSYLVWQCRVICVLLSVPLGTRHHRKGIISSLDLILDGDL